MKTLLIIGLLAFITSTTAFAEESREEKIARLSSRIATLECNEKVQNVLSQLSDEIVKKDKELKAKIKKAIETCDAEHVRCFGNSEVQNDRSLDIKYPTSVQFLAKVFLKKGFKVPEECRATDRLNGCNQFDDLRAQREILENKMEVLVKFQEMFLSNDKPSSTPTPTPKSDSRTN